MRNLRLADPERHFLYQVNPLLKMGAAIGLTSLALAMHHLHSLGLLAGILLGLVLVSVRIPWRVWLYSTISIVVFLWWAVGFQDRTHLIVNFLRLGAMLLPTPLMAGTTRPTDLIRALQFVRLPNYMVLSLMLIWRFLPLMQQETYRILEANQLRGIDLLRQPQYWFSGLFMPLIFRTVAYADDVTVGLETRGYDPTAPRSNSAPLTWRASDTVFLGGTITIIAIAIALEWSLWI